MEERYKAKNCSIFPIDIATFMETAMIIQRYLVRSLEKMKGKARTENDWFRLDKSLRCHRIDLNSSIISDITTKFPIEWHAHNARTALRHTIYMETTY